MRVYQVILDPASAGKTVSPAAPPVENRSRMIRIALGGVAVVAASLLGWYFWTQSTTVDAAKSPVLPDKPSLVVLPFDNLSDDKEQSYLADGITEDLTTELARVPGLLVVSRNAAFSYKDQSIQPKQIASELGVRYVLEGSLRRVGNELRINAQLIDATSSGHLWAEKFDGAWSDVFDFQDRIVDSIAAALKLRLVQSQYTSDTPGGTTNPAAYQELLFGLNSARRQTPKDVAEAARHYKQALVFDPQFGRAAAELAWVYWMASGVKDRTDALGVTDIEAAKQNVELLQLASRNPSASYLQLVASRLSQDKRSDEAIDTLEKAIALDASDPWNYEILSEALTYNGRPSDGLAYVDAALRIDPSWTGNRHYLYGLAQFTMGRYEDAVASFASIEPETSDHWAYFLSLILRISSYGYLERPDAVAAVSKLLEPLLADRYLEEVSGLLARTYFPFKQEADLQRVLDGLAKAHIPHLPFGFDARSNDRLSADESKTLVFGHKIAGRQLVSGNNFWRMTGTDGASTATSGSVTDSGRMIIENDTSCIFYPIWGRICQAYFRNPNGTFDQKNEYVIIHIWDRAEVSVVE